MFPLNVDHRFATMEEVVPSRNHWPLHLPKFIVFFYNIQKYAIANLPFPQNMPPLNSDMATYKDKLVQMCRLFSRLGQS